LLEIKINIYFELKHIIVMHPYPVDCVHKGTARPVLGNEVTSFLTVPHNLLVVEMVVYSEQWENWHKA